MVGCEQVQFGVPMFRREDELERAERFFNRGDVEQAAWILWEARRRALKDSDSDRIAEIETQHAVLRERLSCVDRLPRFDGVKGSGSDGQPGVPLHRKPARPQLGGLDLQMLTACAVDLLARLDHHRVGRLTEIVPVRRKSL
jgi:hypothetical protein